MGVTENPTNNEETVTPEPEEDKPIEETSSVSQMQVDADYIKANYSFIKPLEGQITSRFGLRERVEPKYHTGIDIAEDLGFDIVAAMEGTVEFVSGEGNYGNHLKITGNVTGPHLHFEILRNGELVNPDLVLQF